MDTIQGEDSTADSQKQSNYTRGYARTRNWTIAIASIQILLALIGLVFFADFVHHLILSSDVPTSNHHQHSSSNIMTDKVSPRIAVDFLLMILLILFLLGGLNVALITGILLLKGAIDKNVDYLRCWTQWINLTVLSVFVSSMTGAAVFREINYNLVYPSIVAIVMNVGCMHIVEKFIREIEADDKRRIDDILESCRSDPYEVDDDNVFMEKVFMEKVLIH